MTVESVEPVNIVLFCFSSHPLAKNFHQKGLSHGYYLMGGHEISTSRSLEMIGKISLVMWLHFNQSYSNNLSMWEINKIITNKDYSSRKVNDSYIRSCSCGKSHFTISIINNWILLKSVSFPSKILIILHVETFHVRIVSMSLKMS